MQPGDCNAILVTTLTDKESKQEYCLLRIGRYTEVRLTIDQAMLLATAIERARHLVLTRHLKRVSEKGRTVPAAAAGR